MPLGDMRSSCVAVLPASSAMHLSHHDQLYKHTLKAESGLLHAQPITNSRFHFINLTRAKTVQRHNVLGD